MKVMFSAGEASGDTHAASVANALREIDPSVEMFGMGGTLDVYKRQHKEWLKLAAYENRLPEMVKTVKQLQKEIDALKAQLKES